MKPFPSPLMNHTGPVSSSLYCIAVAPDRSSTSTPVTRAGPRRIDSYVGHLSTATTGDRRVAQTSPRVCEAKLEVLSQTSLR